MNPELLAQLFGGLSRAEPNPGSIEYWMEELDRARETHTSDEFSVIELTPSDVTLLQRASGFHDRLQTKVLRQLISMAYHTVIRRAAGYDPVRVNWCGVGNKVAVSKAVNEPEPEETPGVIQRVIAPEAMLEAFHACQARGDLTDIAVIHHLAKDAGLTGTIRPDYVAEHGSVLHVLPDDADPDVRTAFGGVSRGELVGFDVIRTDSPNWEVLYGLADARRQHPDWSAEVGLAITLLLMAEGEAGRLRVPERATYGGSNLLPHSHGLAVFWHTPAKSESGAVLDKIGPEVRREITRGIYTSHLTEWLRERPNTANPQFWLDLAERYRQINRLEFDRPTKIGAVVADGVPWFVAKSI